jgi:hypothetical protein
MQRLIRKFGFGVVMAIALTAWMHAASAPVADAAMARDREAVKTLLTGGADVNAAQGDGMDRAALGGKKRRCRAHADAAVRRREREGHDAPWRVHAADDGGRTGPRHRDCGARLGRRRCESRQRAGHDGVDAGRAVRQPQA